MKSPLVILLVLCALVPLSLAASPILLDSYVTPNEPNPDQLVAVTAVIRDDNLVWVKVYYSFDGGVHYNSDAMHPINDYWSAQIHPINKKVQVLYYIKAEDEEGNSLKSESFSFWFGGEQPNQEVFINYEQPIKYYRNNDGSYVAQTTYSYRSSNKYDSQSNLYYSQSNSNNYYSSDDYRGGSSYSSSSSYYGGSGSGITINNNINLDSPGYKDYYRNHGYYPRDGYYYKNSYKSHYWAPYPTPYFQGYYAYYWPRIPYRSGYYYSAYGSYWND